MTATEDDRITDHIHAALEELSALGIVKSVDETRRKVTLDTVRLFSIGYSIVFDSTQPAFLPNEHTMYLYDAQLYLDDTIPIESMRSFCMLRIKAAGASL